MAANGRGNMRPAGRSPPFLAIGLFVALVILGFNYWSLSARNGEQSNEIVLLESELRLVNAKKTSAEKRSEAISDKVTELEKQLNEQKEVIAKNQAELANVEKEKLTFLERTNELENEVRNIRDQQLPSCETDKKNLQQEVEQLRADIEVHKNKECGKSDCETFVARERDATLEDVYKAVGASPLISMHKSNANLGSYRDQISKLAAQMDQEALKKQAGNQQPVDTQQHQQQQPFDTQQQQQQQQQQQLVDTQQQQQVDTQQQQQVDTQQQQQLVDTQQQQPVDIQQQIDTKQQEQLADTQQAQPVDTQQAQPVDTQQQQPVDTQQQRLDTQQQQVDVQQQEQPLVDTQQAGQNVETGHGVVPAPDLNQARAGETSNLNEDIDGRAVDVDRQLDAQQEADRDVNTPVDGNDDDDDDDGALDDYKDEDDADDLTDVDTLRVNHDNEKTDRLRQNDDGIDEMFQRDRDVAAAPPQ